MDHAKSAARFAADEARTHWHDQALYSLRVKRDRAAATVPEWEQLRETAALVKEHTLSRLAEYLEEFERNARQNGIQVHWARDGEEHNAIVHGILARHGATRLVKSKSMLTEECHLNPYLEARGIEVVSIVFKGSFWKYTSFTLTTIGVIPKKMVRVSSFQLLSTGR